MANNATRTTAWNKLITRLGVQSDAEERLITDAMETIDRAMDIQQILYELSTMVNRFYRCQILIVVLCAFLMIVFDTYYLLLLIAGNDARIGNGNLIL